jgi:hypothetical protein
MQTPEDVQAMLKLASLGWGAKRIAAELGCSRNTVRRYVRQGGWQAYQAPPRPGKLSEHAQWLAERFRQHRGNCDVVRQELQRELGIAVSLRTVERAVAHLRREVLAQSVATVRFETPPGHQLQIDFGTVREGAPVRRDAGLLTPNVRRGVPARAPVGVAARPGRRVPALRWPHPRAAAGQRPSAGRRA